VHKQPSKKETRAEKSIREAPLRVISDSYETHPLARALLIQFITEQHNQYCNGNNLKRSRYMCKELRVFPRSNLRRDPKLLFVHLPPAAFI
jgi:hypothetical protein